MEQLTLNMIPNGYTPTAHISQYDVGRHIRFNLQNINLAGNETVTLKIRKTNGELVTKTIENHTSYVEYVSEKADCDYSGTANCEIVISKDNTVLGSKNFLMKVEADAYDGAGVVTETASGQIATFDTNMVDVLQEVKCEINATGGNGTPDNPIPINGYTEANITRCGKNIFNYDLSDATNIVKYVQVKTGNGTFTMSSDVPLSEGVAVLFFLGGYQTMGATTATNGVSNGIPRTVTTNDGYVTFAYRYYGIPTITPADYNIQLEIGSTATAYAPYNGNTYTIAFGQTVYGGVLDVTRGKLHVTYEKAKLSDLTFAKSGNKFYTRAFADSPTGASFTDNFLCSIFKTVNKDWQHLLNGECCLRASLDVNYKWSFVFCSDEYETVTDFLAILTDESAITYPLATPFDIDLTPVQIEALLGVNNVWHDGNGDTEVKYLYNA